MTLAKSSRKLAAQLPAVVDETGTKVWRDALKRDALTAIVGCCTFIKSAHRIDTACAELLRRYQGV
jgi:hypothetical protein